MHLHFPCPECGYPSGLELPGDAESRCPRCDHIVHPVTVEPDPALPACALCGCRELYKKKDFPHGLGMAILVAACLASTVTFYLYAKWLTWAILIGSAAFDGILYLLVKDVAVCYRCGCHHRGSAAAAHHAPFELTLHERYRQERIRREQLEKRG
jgi:hypothetical protein